MNLIYTALWAALFLALFADKGLAVSVSRYRNFTGSVFVLSPTPIQINTNIKLAVNTTTVNAGDWVKVSFSGITPSKNNSDYIALYTPGDLTTVQTKIAAKYVRISNLSPVQNGGVNFNATGSGSYVFKMVSSRYNFRFGYFQGSTLYPTISALSPEIVLLNPNAPLKGHIGITGNNKEVTIHWNTRDISGVEVVYYGTTSSSLTLSAKPFASRRFLPADLCGPEANSGGYVDPGYTHWAILPNLTYNTKYYYKFGSDCPGFGLSEVYSFRSLSAVGPEQTVYFFATADVGSQPADNATVPDSEPGSRLNLPFIERDLKNNDLYNLYHLHGDISYADGQQTFWDNYFDQWSPNFLTGIPQTITEGNHERDWFGSGDRFDIYPGSTDNSGGECGVQTYYFFQQPTPFAGQKTNLWYSFEYGPIHFIHYSTERPLSKGTPQYNFIIDDFAKINRTKTPWVVVAGHRMMYASSNYCNEVCETPGVKFCNYTNCTQDSDVGTEIILQEAFDDIFYENHVDVVWQGHYHRYEKSCPVWRQDCQGFDKNGTPNATIYINMGNGGQGLSGNNFVPYPKWYQTTYAKQILANGYTRLKVNQTNFIQESVYGANGTVMDTLSIYKPATWGPSFKKLTAPSTSYNYTEYFQTMYGASNNFTSPQFPNITFG